MAYAVSGAGRPVRRRGAGRGVAALSRVGPDGYPRITAGGFSTYAREFVEDGLVVDLPESRLRDVVHELYDYVEGVRTFSRSLPLADGIAGYAGFPALPMATREQMGALCRAFGVGVPGSRLPAVVRAFIEQYADAEIEHGLVCHPDGMQSREFCDGSARWVSMSAGPDYCGGVSIHNHPMSGSFSGEDFVFGIETGLSRIAVIRSPDGPCPAMYVAEINPELGSLIAEHGMNLVSRVLIDFHERFRAALLFGVHWRLKVKDRRMIHALYELNEPGLRRYVYDTIAYLTARVFGCPYYGVSLHGLFCGLSIGEA